VGQKQRWFLLQLAGDEADIRLDLAGAPEFDRWRWVDYWQPVKEVIYFKRPVYVKALHELAPLARPDGPPPYPAWWARQARQGTAAVREAQPASQGEAVRNPD
jgi:putative (di)nucleoside polyphosphate hydrolase